MPLASTDNDQTPTSELRTPPSPPVSAVPPTTTAVTAANSRPSADHRIGLAELCRGEYTGDTEEETGETESHDAHAAQIDAGEFGDVFTAADRHDVTANACVILDDDCDGECSNRDPDCQRKSEEA